MTSVAMVLVPVAMLGAASGIMLLRNGRTVIGRLLLLLLCLPPTFLLADAATSGQWFAAVLAALGFGLTTVAWVRIPKGVSPG
ncbi:hypothetical protein [Nocardia transvalensis]|uniref:hypothetical protein n=1 Tax=Nocardia transvalensis TaxID=37333 RepID=UPI001894AE1A|nr:hypothetical protein [Nocardia transvalensis]MBF6333577.1 hypothetical protein [Nocardia transvalensis]